MKTYKALSIEVVRCDEDIIRTSGGYVSFNLNWLSGATQGGDENFGGGEQ